MYVIGCKCVYISPCAKFNARGLALYITSREFGAELL